MFSDKEFYKVNREERHFGFLLIASIIYDNDFREYFFDCINKCIEKKFFLDKNNYDVYSEAALFRDYWKDLDKDNNYSEKLNRQRKIIELFLEHFCIDKSVIDKNRELFEKKKGKQELRFPGKWLKKTIKSVQEKENINNNELFRIRWACNAKPDLLILSKNFGLLIELKIESKLGKNDSGYDQKKTQSDILNLAKFTIPCFKNMHLERKTLEKNDNGFITWKEIKEKFNDELVKKYMKHIPAEPIIS
jgi:hypothetical protein